MAKRFTQTQISFLKLLDIPEAGYQKTYEDYQKYSKAREPNFAKYLKRMYEFRVAAEWRRQRPVYLGD